MEEERVIAVIEDQPDIVDLLELILQRKNFTVVRAYDTARASQEERQRALEEEGAAAYIVKPFSPRELLETIEEVLSRPSSRTTQTT